jgi:hypothetical protein
MDGQNVRHNVTEKKFNRHQMEEHIALFALIVLDHVN